MKLLIIAALIITGFFYSADKANADTKPDHSRYPNCWSAVHTTHCPPIPRENSNTPGCATNNEIFITPYGATRAQVEARWDVEGLGYREFNGFIGRYAWRYPSCKPWRQNAYDQWAYAAFDNGGMVVAGVVWLTRP